MTDLLFQTDSYLREFEARIVDVDHTTRSLILQATAFYPGGGGQPADRGYLTVRDVQYPVEQVRKEGDAVHHILGGDDPLPQANSSAHGSIDWVRRLALMRTHTALHILCGVVYRDYGALVTGGDMEPLKARMDFEFASMRSELVREIESAVQTEVKAAREIRVKTLPREEAFQIPDLIRTKINLLPPSIQYVRTVEIVGLDLQADGGTHVANTSDVGHIRIANYKSKGAINKRIYIEIS